jgi:hypothetical protein
VSDLKGPKVGAINVLWRGKWAILTFALIGAATAGLVVHLSTPKYLAEASLVYRLGREYFPEYEDWDDVEFLVNNALATEMRLLRSRSVRDSVVHAVDAELILEKKLKDGTDEEVRQQASDLLAEILTVRRVAGALIVTIGARHAVPQIAERIVSSTIDAYLGLRKEVFSPGNLSYFDRPISEAEARRDAIEAEIMAMKARRDVRSQWSTTGIPAQRTDERHLEKLEMDRVAADALLSELFRIRDRFSVNRVALEAAGSKIDVLDLPKARKETVGLSDAGRIGTGFFAGGVMGAALTLTFAWLTGFQARLTRRRCLPMTRNITSASRCAE